MNLIERIELWLTLHSADCNDDDVADLLVNAQDELARMDQENARLRRELELANAEIGDLEDCRESLRRLGKYCGCDHVECADERQKQVQHIHEAFDAKDQEIARLRKYAAFDQITIADMRNEITAFKRKG